MSTSGKGNRIPTGKRETQLRHFQLFLHLILDDMISKAVPVGSFCK